MLCENEFLGAKMKAETSYESKSHRICSTVTRYSERYRIQLGIISLWGLISTVEKWGRNESDFIMNINIFKW